MKKNKFLRISKSKKLRYIANNYKKKLNRNKIYNPNLWSEIVKRKNSHRFKFECDLAKNCIFLPVNEKLSKKHFEKLYEILDKN